MPTNYTGVSTDAQAPGGAPEPEGAPLLALPVDADPPNGSTFSQAYKALADWGAFALRPQSKVADWVKALIRWRSALGHTRSYVDHLGFVSGRVVQWDEWWPYVGGGAGTFGPRRIDVVTPAAAAAPFDATAMTMLGFTATALGDAGSATGVDTAAVVAVIKARLLDAGGSLQAAIAAGMGAAAAPASDDTRGSWLIKGLQAAGGVSQVVPYDPNVGVPRHRYVLIDAGETVGDHAFLFRRPQSTYDNDLSFALEWEQYVGAANMPGRTVYCGLCDPWETPHTATSFAAFQLQSTGTWHYAVRGGGAIVSSDTGVAAFTTGGGWVRMRIEFVGAGVADDGVRAVRFYIDGALVGTMIADLPLTSGMAAANFSVWNTGGGSAGAVACAVGPARFRSNIWPADVL